MENQMIVGFKVEAGFFTDKWVWKKATIVEPCAIQSQQ